MIGEFWIVAQQQFIAIPIRIGTRKHGKFIGMDTLIETNLPLREETDIIIGLAIEVHKILGPGFFGNCL